MALGCDFGSLLNAKNREISLNYQLMDVDSQQTRLLDERSHIEDVFDDQVAGLGMSFTYKQDGVDTKLTYDAVMGAGKGIPQFIKDGNKVVLDSNYASKMLDGNGKLLDKATFLKNMTGIDVSKLDMSKISGHSATVDTNKMNNDIAKAKQNGTKTEDVFGTQYKLGDKTYASLNAAKAALGEGQTEADIESTQVKTGTKTTYEYKDHDYKTDKKAFDTAVENDITAQYTQQQKDISADNLDKLSYYSQVYDECAKEGGGYTVDAQLGKDGHLFNKLANGDYSFNGYTVNDDNFGATKKSNKYENDLYDQFKSDKDRQLRDLERDESRLTKKQTRYQTQLTATQQEIQSIQSMLSKATESAFNFNLG